MYNYVNKEFVEGDATRGTTTLVYLQLHISLYTGTVHVLARVAGIHPLVWPPTRDVGRCPQIHNLCFVLHNKQYPKEKVDSVEEMQVSRGKNK